MSCNQMGLPHTDRGFFVWALERRSFLCCAPGSPPALLNHHHSVRAREFVIATIQNVSVHPDVKAAILHKGVRQFVPEYNGPSTHIFFSFHKISNQIFNKKIMTVYHDHPHYSRFKCFIKKVVFFSNNGRQKFFRTLFKFF